MLLNTYTLQRIQQISTAHLTFILKKGVYFFMFENNKLAISYCRKSTKIKNKSVEESIGYQRQDIMENAKNKVIHIVREFSDVGYSGKNLDRPELKEMIDFLKTTHLKIDELIIYSIDRLGRELKHNIQQMREVTQLVGRVHFVTMPMPDDSIYFKFMFLATTAMAQEERERILTRCSAGRKQKVLNRKSFDGNYFPL